jgi:hypothetical protein
MYVSNNAEQVTFVSFKQIMHRISFDEERNSIFYVTLFQGFIAILSLKVRALKRYYYHQSAVTTGFTGINLYQPLYKPYNNPNIRDCKAKNALNYKHFLRASVGCL